jgi:hypothetical protein
LVAKDIMAWMVEEAEEGETVVVGAEDEGGSA